MNYHFPPTPRSLLLPAFLLLLLLALPLHAQTAAEVQTLLESPVVSCGQGAFFVLDGEASSWIAFEQVRENGWLPANAVFGDPLTLGAASFLIMRALDMKGGIMYTVFPGPRTAFHDLVRLSIIQGRIDPAGKINGWEFLHILDRALNAAGEGE
ncbi:MAG: hypothetical protein LBT39_01590 [Treponema sp.]|jgi:hypothetical protein|nr:hypothetical protein [Treponema sp.]